MKVMNEISNSAHVLIELHVLMFEWSFYVENCGTGSVLKKSVRKKNNNNKFCRITEVVNASSIHTN